ncbi:hypothetical protein ACQKWADRAFT_282433 [Trichoderma austrokoningii]
MQLIPPCGLVCTGPLPILILSFSLFFFAYRFSAEKGSVNQQASTYTIVPIHLQESPVSFSISCLSSFTLFPVLLLALLLERLFLPLLP